MNTKTTTLFWLTTLLILLLSIIVSLYSSHSSVPTSSLISRAFNVEFLSRVMRHHRHHHHQHHQHSMSCNESSQWKSSLISLYNVSDVLTVGSKGCANFSSVQKAVDAVPDFSHSWTLIMVDSGTYR